MLSSDVLCLNEAERKTLANYEHHSAEGGLCRSRVDPVSEKIPCNRVRSGDVPVPFITATHVAVAADSASVAWFRYICETVQHKVDINCLVSCCIKCTMNNFEQVIILVAIFLII